MDSDFTLHHIGYTVADIDESAHRFQDIGYTIEKQVYDEKLTVELCYLHKDGEPTIELVHQRNPESLETKLLNENGTMPYHLGYIVPSIDATFSSLIKKGYTPLFSPIPVNALGGTLISYLHHPTLGYIEILQK